MSNDRDTDLYATAATGEASREEEEKEGQELHLEMSAKRASEPDMDDGSEPVRDYLCSKLKLGLNRENFGEDEDNDDDDDDDADDDDDGDDDDDDDNDDDDDDDEEEKEEDYLMKINPELSRQMVQALKYRIAQKRSMRKVALVLRAELAQTGLVKGMRVRAAAIVQCVTAKRQAVEMFRRFSCIRDVILLKIPIQPDVPITGISGIV